MFTITTLACTLFSFGQEPITFQLHNKIPVTRLHSPASAPASVAVYIKAGHLYNANQQGLAHLYEHIFNLGNIDANPAAINQLLAKYGGERRAGASTTSLRFWYSIDEEALAPLFSLLAGSFSSLNLDDDTVNAQVIAIDNEWVQKNDMLELIDWEQTFQVFAHPVNKVNSGQPFFMGNKEAFGPRVADLKKQLNQRMQKLQPNDIKVIISTSFPQSVISKLLNQSLGRVTFAPPQADFLRTNDEKINYTSITELRETKKRPKVRMI
nr:insulinase family protein [Alteromonas sp. ASW11-130]